MRLRAPLLVAALLAACEPQPPGADANALLIDELRALRHSIGETPRPALDKAALTEALEPLRTALQGLVQDQQELRTRQTALTEELQRWTAVVGSRGCHAVDHRAGRRVVAAGSQAGTSAPAAAGCVAAAL